MFVLNYLLILLNLQFGLILSFNYTNGRFIINNDVCQIPYMDLYTDDVVSRVANRSLFNCRLNKDIVTTEYDFDLKQYRFHLNETVGASILRTNETKTIVCKYRQIVRDDFAERPDDRVRPIRDIVISEGDLLPKDTDYSFVLCKKLNNGTKPTTIQMDAMAFVQDRQSNDDVKEKTAEGKPNVIILGLDSMSRNNFHRTMPRTVEFLEHKGWYQLKGMNTVGDNTFPNLLALLTGLSKQDAKQICDVREPGCLDKLPFIWNRFNQSNYTTAYAEDCVDINAFNYRKSGFVKQPVDYYLRPLMVAMEQILPLRYYMGNVHCVGRHLSFGYVWDFAQQYIERFIRKSVPMFGVFWTNSFTHDVFDGSTALDDLFVDYLEQFKRDGLFNSSIVILMSDHGMRFKELRRIPTGYLEERLPMSYIYIPRWYRRLYPHFIYNLILNGNRLSSIYDMHLTIQHFLQPNSTSMAEFNTTGNHCESCQSLLFQLPENRTCDEAGIPESLCACTNYKTITKEPYAESLADLVVERLNENLIENNLTEYCMNYTLKKVINLDVKMPIDEKLMPDAEYTYLIKFKTLPKLPIFEAKFDWDNGTSSLTMDMSDIRRVNYNRNYKKCLEDKNMQKYCICR